MNKIKRIKGRKLKKIKFRKLSEKRWRKKLKRIRNNNGKTKKQINRKNLLLRNGLIILGVNERVVEGIQGLVLLLLVFLTYVKNKDGVLE